MLIIKPNQGIGPIFLGMPRREVARVMTTNNYDCRHTLQRDIYSKGKIVVDYQNDEVVSVCINRDPYTPSLEPQLFGFNPLQQQAHQTIMRMSLKAIYDHADPQLGMSYIYPDLGIYFWRDTTPEDLEKEMQYQRTAGSTKQAWYTQAVKDYKQFHVVGVFARGYL